MPAFTVVLAFLKGGLGWLWEFFSSHIGQLVLVGMVAWFWAGHRANVRCEARFDAERAAAVAAANAEAARQADAAREIAEAATARLEEEQAIESDMLAQIEAYDKEETKADANSNLRAPRAHEDGKPACSPVVVRPCRVDDVFVERMRRLDATAHRRAPRPARGAR